MYSPDTHYYDYENCRFGGIKICPETGRQEALGPADGNNSNMSEEEMHGFAKRLFKDAKVTALLVASGAALLLLLVTKPVRK